MRRRCHHRWRRGCHHNCIVVVVDLYIHHLMYRHHHHLHHHHIHLRRYFGRIHTGSGSVPDSSEPYASGRLSVGFAFTLQTTDPTRTVRVHFAVYTLRLLRDRL